MLTSLRPLAVTIAAGAASIALLAGCTVTSSTPEVSSTDLQKEVAAQLESKIALIDDVSCDGGLEATVGAKQNCRLSVRGEWVDAEVSAKTVDGDNVNFDIDVDTAQLPGGVEPRTLEETIASRVGEAMGRPVDEVVCTETLAPMVGATQKCKLRDGTSWYDVDNTTTLVEGTNVKFNLKVSENPTSPPTD